MNMKFLVKRHNRINSLNGNFFPKGIQPRREGSLFFQLIQSLTPDDGGDAGEKVDM